MPGARDVEVFRNTFRKLLEGPAYMFLRNWLSITAERDSIFHILSKVPENQREAFNKELSLITEVLTFPAEKGSHGRYILSRTVISIPLDRTGLAKVVSGSNDTLENFYGEVHKLLLGPASDLLATLHAVNWSKKTIDG